MFAGEGPSERSVTASAGSNLTAQNGSITGSTLIVDGSTVEVNEAQNWNSVQIINGGVLTHRAATLASDAKLILTTPSLVIDASSRIDVSGKGLGVNGATGRSGGSYGGRGGANRGVSNAQYGDIRNPLDFGSGGSGNGLGGGVVKIIADALQLDGEIRANGSNGPTNSNTGGGSGGAIWLDVTTLSGAGSVNANGGHGAYYQGAGGSGGRIAVHYGGEQF